MKRDKVFRDEIIHKTYKDVLDEIIIQIALESIIDVEAGLIIRDLDERAKIHRQQNNLAKKWKTTADPILKEMKPTQTKKEAIEPAKGPIDRNNKHDISESLWYDNDEVENSDPVVGEASRPQSQQENFWKNMFTESTKRKPLLDRDQTLKQDLKSSLDGTYLPTPRAKGVIWSSSKLPPRKVLLSEMIEDARFLIDWIRSG